MLFFQQLRGELRKLLAKPRTWMGYGAFLILEAVILWVYQLDRSRNALKGTLDRNNLEFGDFYSSLTVTFTIMIFSMVLLGAIFFALVGGDIVAKENEDGNLRLVFARPVSRFRLLLVKYAATCLYTLSFVLFVGVTGYLMAGFALGFEGGLFVMDPKMKVFAAYPEWADGFARLALCGAGMALCMLTISSLAFMLSCLKIKPAAATILTLAILFVDMILQNFPFFKPYETWFITWRMSAWIYLAEPLLSWAKLLDSFALLLGLNLSFFTVGWAFFKSRDFKT